MVVGRCRPRCRDRYRSDDVPRMASRDRVSLIGRHMRPHPFLRAYMAGIVVPTLVLIGIMAVVAYHPYYFEVPNQFVIPMPGRPLERAIIFPMAVVPNVW